MAARNGRSGAVLGWEEEGICLYPAMGENAGLWGKEGTWFFTTMIAHPSFIFSFGWDSGLSPAGILVS